jgi:hypothetical protein
MGGGNIIGVGLKLRIVFGDGRGSIEVDEHVAVAFVGVDVGDIGF